MRLRGLRRWSVLAAPRWRLRRSVGAGLLLFPICAPRNWLTRSRRLRMNARKSLRRLRVRVIPGSMWLRSIWVSLWLLVFWTSSGWLSVLLARLWIAVCIVTVPVAVCVVCGRRFSRVLLRESSFREICPTSGLLNTRLIAVRTSATGLSPHRRVASHRTGSVEAKLRTKWPIALSHFTGCLKCARVCRCGCGSTTVRDAYSSVL